MQRTHKIRLYPNNKQATYLARCCGVARFAYNWGLAKWNEQYEAHKANPDAVPKPSRFSLNKQLNAVKREEFPWMMEVTKYAPQKALINLENAFAKFFKKTGKHPKFKRKGDHDSFYVGADKIKVGDNKVWITGLGRFLGKRSELAWVRMSEPLRYAGSRIVCATVSKTADDWFIAITCEVDQDLENVRGSGTVGIDLGVGEYVTSDGEFHEVSRSYRHSMRRLRRAQQALSRKSKGSKNLQKQKRRVARIHQRIANVRQDWLHKLSDKVTRQYDTIVLEDLNVKGMGHNHRLAISVLDAGFGEFRRQVEYKSKERGCKVVIADRWYPSSKTCSRCGKVKTKLPLSERVFECDGCGFVCHRDLNAAINLKNLAASSAVSACGEFSASVPGISRVHAASAKQEETIAPARSD